MCSIYTGSQNLRTFYVRFGLYRLTKNLPTWGFYVEVSLYRVWFRQVLEFSFYRVWFRQVLEFSLYRVWFRQVLEFSLYRVWFRQVLPY